MRKTIFFLLLFIPTFLFADIISGYVLGEDGDPIPYASVYVKTNPQLGTMTDSLGYYSININPSTDYSDHLIISFIGYRTEELSIASLQASQSHQTTLVEQPIMLEGATVKAKISRKESRKIKKDALAKFIAQMRADFPARTVVYPIFSMYNGSQDNRQLIHHEIVGEITELPLKKTNGADSMRLVVKSVKSYNTEEVKAGYEKFNELADDRLNGKKKNRRKNKQNIYPKRDLEEQSLAMHRFLWGGQIYSLVEALNDEKISKWDYTMVDDYAVLTYYEETNFLGIFKGELQFHFYVDPITFKIHKAVQSLVGEIHIPFGYKLRSDELEFINALQFGQERIEQYRVRHAYVDVKRNVIFNRQNETVIIREKNLEVNGTLIDKKKKKLTYRAEAKAIVSGVPKITKK